MAFGPGFLARPDQPPPAPVVLVTSGKGGVGKSTVAVSLALGLAGAGQRVGLIDADIHAPDVPLMLGLSRTTQARSLTIHALPGTPGARLQPVEWRGLQVSSAGFLVADAQALALAGGLAEALLARLLWSTAWDGVTCLVVDMPPGTGVITQFALGLRDVMTVLVVTPEHVAHLDTGRLVDLVASHGREVIGGVENMAYYPCPHCGSPGPIYPPADPAVTIWTRVTKLASVPALAALGPSERLDAIRDSIAPVTASVVARLT